MRSIVQYSEIKSFTVSYEKLLTLSAGTKKDCALETTVDITSVLSFVKKMNVVFEGGSSKVFNNAFEVTSGKFN